MLTEPSWEYNTLRTRHSVNFKLGRVHSNEEAVLKCRCDPVIDGIQMRQAPVDLNSVWRGYTFCTHLNRNTCQFGCGYRRRERASTRLADIVSCTRGVASPLLLSPTNGRTRVCPRSY